MKPGADLMAKVQDSGRNGCADNHHQHPKNPAGSDFAPVGFGEQPPQSLFQGGNQLSDPHDRVRDAVGISNQQIDAKSYDQRKKRQFHSPQPPACMVKIEMGFCPVIR